MTQREREPLAAASIGDLDPHLVLFGDDDDADSPPERLTRADRHHNEHAHRRRRTRRGRLIVALTVVIVAAVAALVVPWVVGYFAVPDYSGSGQGSVTIVITSGASAGDIGDILKKAGVVKSTKAFVDAARDNSKSVGILPGRYTLARHLSGKAALGALLDPNSRNADSDVVVPEGVATFDIAAEMVKACGANRAKVDTALQRPADLGVPVTYRVSGNVPSSAEGFLYPATYTPDSCANPADVLQRMVSRFIQQDRDTNFARDAKLVGLTP